MNTKSIFRNMWSTAGAAALLFSAVATASCSDDDTEGGVPYFRLENTVVSSKLVSNPSELGFDVGPVVGDPTVELIRYDIRSNCDWTVECNSTDADEWLLIYPKSGQGDGKVRFCVTDNDATATRSTTVVFRYADGRQTQATLAVNQFGSEPYIRFYVDGAAADRIEGGRYAQQFRIEVASNVDPFYAMPQLDWATFTETGNGTFTLDMTDYPTEPTALERSAAIAFKGSGAYASVAAQLDILQTIEPKIAAVCPDEEEGSLPPFPATKPAPQVYTVSCNWDWTVEQEAEDDWFTVTPSSGEAGKEYTVTIAPQTNTGETRSATFSIVSQEVLGVKARKTIELMQEGNATGAPMSGLEEPVKWFFNGAEGADYTVATKQFVEDNDLKPQSGVGSLSYHHTYEEQTGTADPDCARFIGGTGQPYVTGAWPGDYWLFSTPVKNLKTGTKVRFTGCTRISGTGQKYWRLEYTQGAAGEQGGRHDLEGGLRTPDRHLQRPDVHLHPRAAHLDAQPRGRRHGDLQASDRRRSRRIPLHLRGQLHGRQRRTGEPQRRYDPLGQLERDRLQRQPDHPGGRLIRTNFPYAARPRRSTGPRVVSAAGARPPAADDRPNDRPQAANSRR